MNSTLEQVERAPALAMQVMNRALLQEITSSGSDPHVEQDYERPQPQKGIPSLGTSRLMVAGALSGRVHANMPEARACVGACSDVL